MGRRVIFRSFRGRRFAVELPLPDQGADVLMQTVPAAIAEPAPMPVEMAPDRPLAAAYDRRIIGTTNQVEVALEALARLGIEGKPLALAAIEAVGVIVRLGGRSEVELHRHVRQENTASGETHAQRNSRVFAEEFSRGQAAGDAAIRERGRR